MNKRDFYIVIISFISLLMISCTDKKQDKAGYAGENLSDIAFILRDKEKKQASLEIKTNDKWAIYAGTSVDSIDFSKPISEGTTNGIFALPINKDEHLFFQLVTPSGRAIIAEKHLPMSGGYNFRDMGGIKNKDGKHVKWGKVFRSDDLNNLTKEDLEYLSSIPLTSIVDFRHKSEIDKAPDKLPSSVKERYELSISPGNLMAVVENNEKKIPMDSLMMELNKLLVSDSASIKQYQEFFGLLQNSKNAPLLFHCSAGKDRTGMAAALFLFSLNVDEKTIIEDYLSSNIYLGDKYSDIISEHPELKPLMEVRKEYLESGLEYIKKEHGSVEKFLSDVLKVDTNKMKELYLY